MMRTTMWLMGCLMLVCTVFGADKDFDFRKTRWGMSRSEVLAAEEYDLHEGEKVFTSKTHHQLADFDAVIGYVFTDDRLVRAGYIIDEKHTNRNDHIHDYTTLKKLLTKKYGEPIEDEVLWFNDLYRDDVEQWGTAVSIGHLNFYSQWDLEETMIMLLLTGENFDTNHKIEYKSKKLAAVEQEARESSVMDDL